MTYKAEFSPDAISGLDEIFDYISDVLKKPTAAQSTIDEILDKADLLSGQP